MLPGSASHRGGVQPDQLGRCRGAVAGGGAVPAAVLQPDLANPHPRLHGRVRGVERGAAEGRADGQVCERARTENHPGPGVAAVPVSPVAVDVETPDDGGSRGRVTATARRARDWLARDVFPAGDTSARTATLAALPGRPAPPPAPGP